MADPSDRYVAQDGLELIEVTTHVLSGLGAPGAAFGVLIDILVDFCEELWAFVRNLHRDADRDDIPGLGHLEQLRYEAAGSLFFTRFQVGKDGLEGAILLEIHAEHHVGPEQFWFLLRHFSEPLEQ